MGIRQFILYLLFVTTLTSCDFGNVQDPNNLVFLNYHLDNNIYKTDSIYLDKITDSKTTKHIYKIGKDTLALSFTKSEVNDSSIVVYNHNCPLVSRKNIEIEGKVHEIKKYYYDVKESSDEETSFYCHDEYGILLVFDNGWLNLIHTLDYDSISKKLTENILSDKTGFYPNDFLPEPNKYLYLMQDFETNMTKFNIDTLEVNDHSSDGGELLVFHSNKMDYLVFDFWLYGETGKLNYTYWTDKEFKFRFIKQVKYEYDKPYYEVGYQTDTLTCYLSYLDPVTKLFDQDKKELQDKTQVDSIEKELESFFIDVTKGIEIIK